MGTDIKNPRLPRRLPRRAKSSLATASRDGSREELTTVQMKRWLAEEVREHADRQGKVFYRLVHQLVLIGLKHTRAEAGRAARVKA